MSLQLQEDIVHLLQQEDTIKILATTDALGQPHAVVKQSLHWDAGNLVFFELIESSKVYKNLTHSLWFNRKVAVTLVGKDGKNYQIKGTPIKNIVAGKSFETAYRKVQEKIPDADLAAIWLIKPEEIVEETYSVRKTAEEAKHPFFVHLDRIKKQPQRGKNNET